MFAIASAVNMDENNRKRQPSRIATNADSARAHALISSAMMSLKQDQALLREARQTIAACRAILEASYPSGPTVAATGFAGSAAGSAMAGPADPNQSRSRTLADILGR